MMSVAKAEHFAKGRMEEYDTEMAYRKERAALKVQAERKMINSNWKRAYGTDKKKGGGKFGAIAKVKGVAKTAEADAGEEEGGGASIDDETKVIFERLDTDSSGNIDKREMEVPAIQ